MININKKSDIRIPYGKISDPDWEVETRTIIEALAENWNYSPSTPKTNEEIETLESRLKTKLPTDLTVFYKTFGIPFIGETLQEFPDIDWLKNMWTSDPVHGPHFSQEDERLLPYLITFSDYLGNGNMLCFHCQTHEIYYFDHDQKPYIAKLFSSASDYIKACLILSQTDLFGPEAEQDDVDTWTQEVVIDMYGEEVVRKWLY